MKMIDLCAGIGGLRMPFEKYGVECILTCEIDKYCQKTYKANFKIDKDHVFLDDIKEIDEKTIKDFDLLCAGFPCQAFSLAGKQRGFDDIRGTIFFDIARIVKEKKPGILLLENVKNIKSHDGGKTFKIIKKTIEDLGYYFESFEFSAEGYVPQKRKRVYMLCLNKNKFKEKDFNNIVVNINNDYMKNKKEVLLKHILEKRVDSKYTLSDKLWSFLQGHAKKHQVKGNGFGYGLVGENDIARTLTARYYKDGSEILIKQKNKNPRKLTTKECARIMGFPENFQIVCSDTQAYKQFGNSVVVPIIEIFAKNIMSIKKSPNN